MQRLLIVEDDAGVRATIVNFLELEGYAVDAVSSTDEALERLSQSTYPIVISDIYIDGRTGLDVLEAARRKDPSCLVILMTARGTMETVMAATGGGAFDCFKPFDLDRMLDTVKRAEQLAPLRWGSRARGTA
jgi:DNA-binding NtrC family response regulator